MTPDARLKALEGAYPAVVESNPRLHRTLYAVVCINDSGSWGIFWRVSNNSGGIIEESHSLTKALDSLWETL